MRRNHIAGRNLATGILSVISVAYVIPIVVVLFNSFKKKAFISKAPFSLPNADTSAGFENYQTAIDAYAFLEAVGWTLFITVFSVLVILVCTSMCAWFITRVQNQFTKSIYLLCVFSMVVPFQMVMFTLSKRRTPCISVHLGAWWSSTWVLVRDWRCLCSAAL